MSKVLTRHVMFVVIITATSFIMFNFQNCAKSQFALREGVTGLSGLSADSDGDGLTNDVEAQLGTDSNNKDSDGDGLLDGEEVNTHKTDPLKQDSDNGGVNDGGEINKGTNPLNANDDLSTVKPGTDNDNDGLTDLQELNETKTDPHDPDSDDDGLLDGEEVNTYKTNPNGKDTDSGGVSDGKEVANGTNPRDNPSDDDTMDTDGDGLTDIYENSISGTDPTLADTDGDNLTDGQEITGLNGFRSTNPKESDTDQDGLSDGDELQQYGTSPNDPDTDKGGVTDGVEVSNGTNPLDSKDDKSIAAVDDDKDGLSNIDEQRIGTDPSNPDSDGDGLNDGAEVLAHGTDPKKYDTDSGGVSDGQEVNVNKTNPLIKSDDQIDPNKDSDGDGLSDIVESTAGTNPMDPDTDKDGLKDGPEVLTHKTDPKKPDSDGGGVNDGTEVQKGTDPNNPKDDLSDPYGDNDKDGLNNQLEKLMGTDPNNPDSDGDGLSDGAESNTYKTDPKKPDTDSGGIDDGVEVARGTNPLDRNDDLNVTSNCKSYRGLAVWSDASNSKQTANSDYLGPISPFKSALSGSDNYAYASASAHPKVGPAPEEGVMKVFLHEGADGMTATFYLNKDNAAHRVATVLMNITTGGNNTSDSVLMSDDVRETKLISSSGGVNKYLTKMWYNKNTDGAVIGPFKTNNYIMHFEVVNMKNVDRIEVHSADNKIYDVKGTHFIIGMRNYLQCECQNSAHKITFTNMPQAVSSKVSGEVVYTTNFLTKDTPVCLINETLVPGNCRPKKSINYNQFLNGVHKFRVLTESAEGTQCEAHFTWEIKGAGL